MTADLVCVRLIRDAGATDISYSNVDAAYNFAEERLADDETIELVAIMTSGFAVADTLKRGGEWIMGRDRAREVFEA